MEMHTRRSLRDFGPCSGSEARDGALRKSAEWIDHLYTPEVRAPEKEPDCECESWVLLDDWMGGHRPNCAWHVWRKASRAATDRPQDTSMNAGGSL